jgi:hypothetical protein
MNLFKFNSTWNTRTHFKLTPSGGLDNHFRSLSSVSEEKYLNYGLSFRSFLQSLHTNYRLCHYHLI